MNKQEALEQIEQQKEAILQMQSWAFYGYIEGLVKQLDEPQKPVVPQFVADWIEYCKTNEISLGYALYCSEEASDKKAYDWIVESLENQETFARAWLYGYEVEKEKRYLVKMKGVDSRTNYLYYGVGSKTWLFKAKLIDGNFRKSHTRKELEEAGFGWVFDCPGIEIEEVPE